MSGCKCALDQVIGGGVGRLDDGGFGAHTHMDLVVNINVVFG